MAANKANAADAKTARLISDVMSSLRSLITGLRLSVPAQDLSCIL